MKSSPFRALLIFDKVLFSAIVSILYYFQCDCCICSKVFSWNWNGCNRFVTLCLIHSDILIRKTISKLVTLKYCERRCSTNVQYLYSSLTLFRKNYKVSCYIHVVHSISSNQSSTWRSCATCLSLKSKIENVWKLQQKLQIWMTKTILLPISARGHIRKSNTGN